MLLLESCIRIINGEVTAAISCIASAPLTSPHLTSPHLTSPHLPSPPLPSSPFPSPAVPPLLSPDLTSLRLVTFFHYISCCPKLNSDNSTRGHLKNLCHLLLFPNIKLIRGRRRGRRRGRGRERRGRVRVSIEGEREGDREKGKVDSRDVPYSQYQIEAS